MSIILHSELLKDKEVLKEIDRFKWIESEKAVSCTPLSRPLFKYCGQF